MNVTLIIVGSIILFCIIGLIIDVSLRFDLGKNKGYLIVRVFKVPVFNLKLKIEGNILNLSSNKKKPFKFAINKQNIDFIKLLKKNFAHRLYLSCLNLDFFIILDNPAIATLLSSSLVCASSLLRYKLKSYQRDADIITQVYTGFGNNQVVILLDLKVTISVIDLIWAIIITIFTRRGEYDARRRKIN